MAKIKSVRFVAYGCPEAPDHLRWIGEILLTLEPTKARPNPQEQWFNMRFRARSKDGAIAAAEAWWKREQAELAAEKVKAAERAERNRRAAA